MIRKALTFVFAVTWIAACPSVHAGEIVDRIVATVNGQIILQSDWEEEIRYEAFVDGHALDALPAATRKAALDRLIDQELLKEQMRSSDLPHASESEVQRKVEEIRKGQSGCETDSGWRAVLSHYRFTEDELKRHVSLDLDLMRLVDARLGPNVNIDAKSIESYYNQEILPQIRQTGEKEVPLAEVRPKIKEILTQQRLNELLVAWLQNLRSGSEIQTQLDSRGELR